MSFSISPSTEQYALSMKNYENSNAKPANDSETKELSDKDTKNTTKHDTVVSNHLKSYTSGLNLSVDDSQDLY